MPPLTRTELDLLRCETPDCECDAIDLNPACHPAAGVDVSYSQGVLTFICHRCQHHVTRILVAPATAH